MSCRTGPLRVGRAFHAFLSYLGGIESNGPAVGRDHASADQREAHRKSSLHDKVYTSRSDLSTRSGPVRQDSFKQAPT